MTLTLSRKLGLGFSSIILLMCVTAAVILQAISSINRSEQQLTSVRFPTVLASKDLLNGVNSSIAALRGYMLMEADNKKATEQQQLRSQALTSIDDAVIRLQNLSTESQDQQTASMLQAVIDQLDQFKQLQLEIETISNTDDNIPSFALMIYDAGPFAETILDQLDVLLKEEVDLEPTRERKNLLKLFADNQSSFSNAFSFIRSYLISGSEEDKLKYQQSMEINQQKTAEINRQAFLFNEVEKNFWGFYLDMREAFSPLADEIFELRGAEDWNIANHKMAADLVPIAQKITTQVDAIITTQGQLMALDQQALHNANQRIGFVVKLSTGLAVIASVLIAMLFARQLLTSLTPINQRAQRISNGDLSGDDLPITSNDELGQLTIAINRMSQQLRSLVSDVSQSAGLVTEGSEQLSEANQKISNGMQEQTEKISSIATAIEEMSATSAEVAQNTATAASNATDCVDIARDGGDTVKRTIATIDAIHNAVSESNQSIESLSAKGQEVGRITEVIRAIAEQTNLLALNAAIEAARAGDQGRGFAVVADEVRQLAKRTSESTEEIAQSIQSIQQETNKAVQKMASGMKLVDEGRASAHVAGDSLISVIDNVNSVSEMVTSIASATEQQSAVSIEVANTVEDISLIIQQAFENTQDNSQSTSNLSQKANDLQRALGRFSVDHTK